MSIQKEKKALLNSSESFLWGVASSGYQSEGGYNGIGQPQNNWSESERHGKVMSTGKAADLWTHYEEDFQICQNLGINSFRLSLEWSRIQPCTTLEPIAPPPFDKNALDAYARLIASCRRHGLEPVVTLSHFTHPAWLGLDAWLEPKTIDYFIEYVRMTVTHINRCLIHEYQLPPIRWYITINEPNILIPNTYLSTMFPSGGAWGTQAALKAYNNLMVAHVRCYDCIHSIYESNNWITPQVSINTYCSDLYWSEKVIWDLLSLKQTSIQRDQLPNYFKARSQELENALIIADLPFSRDLPYKVGMIARKIARWFGRRSFNFKVFEPFFQTLESIPRSKFFDYIAIDYYDPFFAHTFRLPSFSDFEFEAKDFRAWVMSGITSKWWDWRSLPEGLHFFCKYYSQIYDNCPILVAENGMALRRKPDNSIAAPRPDELRRSEFLEAHVQQINRLRDEGVPMVGYIYWSLTDNYEWGSYTPRFGLLTIDYAHGTQRLVEDHLGDRPSETYAKLIQESAKKLL